MMFTRRGFGASLAGAAIVAPWAGKAGAQPAPAFSPALDAIRAHALTHHAFYGLPGLTVGLVAPPSLSTTFDLGFANLDARRPAGPDTLWQVGSISKLMVALVVHQLAAEGKFALTDPIATLMPDIPVPNDAGITVQQLLDHTSGLPDSAPLFPDGGLWVGFKPGTHWSYSNTGYDILGKLAEHYGAKPLRRLLADRLFVPLGMTRTMGAIIGDDRAAYAQGYEPTNNTFPFVRGTRLAPAAWVDVTFGAGSVVSTARDMTTLLRALGDGARGGTLPGLDAAQTHVFLTHAVAPDAGGMRYGNGFMHVSVGGRRYLHHTGGMVSFSSAFHLDPVSGAAAFASSSLSGLAGYRPRELTRFAVDTLDAAMAGKALPAPPRLDDKIASPVQYVGQYVGPTGSFEVLRDGPLVIRANGRTAQLQAAGDDLFKTGHPDFARYVLQFTRKGSTVTGANWGPAQFALRGGRTLAKSDPALARLAGRYVNDSPWWGLIEIVERGGKLYMGTEVPLVAIGGGKWRVGNDDWSPERAAFDNPIDGRPQTFIFSGEKFVRHDI